jgi:hypothetical protein
MSEPQSDSDRAVRGARHVDRVPTNLQTRRE